MISDPIQSWLNNAGRYPLLPAEEMIRLAKKHPGMLLLLTSSEKLVHPFEKHLNPMHQRIGLKPMDLRGFHWLLQGNRPSSESA